MRSARHWEQSGPMSTRPAAVVAFQFSIKISINRCRTLIQASIGYGCSLSQRSILQTPSLLLRFISGEPAITVSYLVNSLGFSPEEALSAPKRVHFETLERPKSVIVFFENHGFTEAQVLSLLRKNPSILLARTEKTLSPKFQFFYSLGLPRTDVARAFSKAPRLLVRSLRNNIIPSFNFWKGFLGSSDKVMACFKRFPSILACEHEKFMGSNVAILREYGVPELNIAALINWQVQTILATPHLFREDVEYVKKLGFDPLKKKFVLAIMVKVAVCKKKWERKMKLYGKLGLSEEEILAAFHKNPWCMATSEDKIKAIMDFLVNTMGLDCSLVVTRPLLLTPSLEKRIIPRCSVVQALSSKGLIKKKFSLATCLMIPEEAFLEKFVTCYKDDAPRLLELYEEKLKCKAR